MIKLQQMIPTEDLQVLNSEEQILYWTGARVLLYLVKYSRLDILNAVYKLLKGMKEAMQDVMKELNQVVKFVLDMKEYDLEMEPKLVDNCVDKWDIMVYSD